MTSPSYSLFCMGNPLLDMQVRNGEALLKKYGLKANDAILAEEKHLPLYDEISTEHELTYVAGGAAQNAARGAAYVLPPGSVVYTGCVGEDELSEHLRDANTREGVESAYMVKAGAQTGACAVVLTGHDRSLVTTLRAAEQFDKAHLESAAIVPLIDGARFFYIGGFFLTHGVESALELARRACDASKVFAMNLSAPFIPQFFKVQLEQVLPYCDYVMGNDAEAGAWAGAAGLADVTDVPAIARALALLPKANAARPRVVIITRGADSTVVVSSDKPDAPKVYGVQALSDAQIVDTNGAGDAFAGGFMGALVLGKDLDECIAVGHKMGSMSVQMIGPQYKYPKVNVL